MNNKAFSKILILVILAILAGGGFFAWQYLGVPEEKMEAPEGEGIEETIEITIQNIKARSLDYEGKTITIEGTYQGWKCCCGNPPVSRSDWWMEDGTDCIYVSEMPAGNLDPLENIGSSIKITGLVKITQDGQPYLEAREVEILKVKLREGEELEDKDWQKKISSLLLFQIEMKKDYIANPTPEKLEQMKAIGMRTEDLSMQRIIIHSNLRPTQSQINELKTMGIIPFLAPDYPDSWIGDLANFYIADMPIDKLQDLAKKDYVVRLDTSEQVLEPQSEPE